MRVLSFFNGKKVLASPSRPSSLFHSSVPRLPPYLLPRYLARVCFRRRRGSAGVVSGLELVALLPLLLSVPVREIQSASSPVVVGAVGECPSLPLLAALTSAFFSFSFR